MKNRIVAEAKTWIGTPFRGHMGIKGYGVDCVHFALEVYRACGVIRGEVVLPGYTIDGGSHIALSAVETYVAQSGFFKLVTEPDIGDMIGIKLGRVVHHVGIVVSDVSFLHAHSACGVVDTRMDSDRCQGRINSIWRPII